MLVGENESGENREQDESAQKDKWADRTFLCTSCVLWSNPPPLCHDSGFSLIECGKKKKAGHVLTRGQSQSAPRGQSLSQPCKFMTAWQLLLWNEACVLWCVTPVRQVKRWNPVHFIGNSTPGVKKAELVNALCVPLPCSLEPLFAS